MESFTGETTQIAKAQAGDSEALVPVLVFHDQSVRRILGNEFFQSDRKWFELDDVVQEAWSSAFRRIGTFNNERASFLTWLVAIGRNVMRDLRRYHLAERRGGGEVHFQMFDQSSIALIICEIVDGADSVATVFSRKETIDMVQRCISQLCESDQELVWARYIEEKSYEQLALNFGMTRNAVRSKCYRLRQELGQIIEGQLIAKPEQPSTLIRRDLR